MPTHGIPAILNAVTSCAPAYAARLFPTSEKLGGFSGKLLATDQESRLLKIISNESIMAVQSKGPAEDVIRGPIKSKTLFPALVLHLLAEQPDHGLGVMQRVEAVCAGLLAVNTNTIYPLLRRLEERGFVIGEWEHPTKRSRRYYRITTEGRHRLERIKSGMLPYLDMLADSIGRLRGELYAYAERAD